ncbi:hypothetical protein HMPREF0972_00372 [Actinomyces sp. oral taxon 848 str. F0332]|nr:hypothetical protein HMPREF0972_00372 [Actinomyces sp. oral taxon 848 str. F0332]
MRGSERHSGPRIALRRRRTFPHSKDGALAGESSGAAAAGEIPVLANKPAKGGEPRQSGRPVGRRRRHGGRLRRRCTNVRIQRAQICVELRLRNRK